MTTEHYMSPEHIKALSEAMTNLEAHTRNMRAVMNLGAQLIREQEQAVKTAWDSFFEANPELDRSVEWRVDSGTGLVVKEEQAAND